MATKTKPADFLPKLAQTAGDFDHTPILRELTGSLPSDTRSADYHEYLAEKHDE